MTNLKVDFKTKEIKLQETLIEKPIYIDLDGKKTEYEDMQELIGALDPQSTNFIKFDHDARSRVLELVGENDKKLGIVHQPFPSEYEGAPYSKDMGVKAVEKLMADNIHVRNVMNKILTKAKEGFFQLEFNLNEISEDHEENKKIWNKVIKPCLTICKYSISISKEGVALIQFDPVE